MRELIVRLRPRPRPRSRAALFVFWLIWFTALVVLLVILGAPLVVAIAVPAALNLAASQAVRHMRSGAR